MSLTKEDQERLAYIRMQTLVWSTITDTESWETPFLIKVIDRQSHLISEYEKRVKA